MIKFRSIGSKFGVIAILNLLFAIVLTGSVSYIVVRSFILHRLKTFDLVQIASLKAEKIDSRIARAIETSRIIASDPTILAWFLSGETNYLLGELSKKKLSDSIKNLNYTTVFAGNLRTKSYWRNSEKNRVYLDEKIDTNSWFYNAISSNKKTQININSDSNRNTFVFINVLMGDTANPVGIAGVSMNFNDVTKEFTENDPELNSKIWLIDSSGMIKISSNPSDLNRNISTIIGNSTEKSILDNFTKDGVLEYDPPGSDRGLTDIVHIKLKTTDWAVVYEIPREKMTGTLTLIFYSTIIISIISILLVSIFFFYGSKFITNPIKQFVTAFSKVSSGEINQKIDLKTNDELELIAERFNNFTEKLLQVLLIVKSTSFKLSDSSNQMKSITGQYSENSQSQAAAIEEITAAIEQISARMGNVSENAGNQISNLSVLTSRLEDLSKIIEEMNDLIQKTVTGTRSISEESKSGKLALDNMTDSMNRIVSSSGDMVNIIGIINDISEKINLLALNASIEAARAGISGKGFAVVAHEISRLADKTAESVKNIDSLIRKNNKEIQNGLSNVELMKDKTESINSGVSAIIDKMNTVFSLMQKQITNKYVVEKETRTVELKSREINDIIKEQKTALSEIVKAINLINDVSQSNTISSNSIAAKSQDLHTFAEVLKSDIQFFKLD